MKSNLQFSYTNAVTPFGQDMCDLFAGRRRGHVGEYRFSKPDSEGDEVDGLRLWDEMTLRAKKNPKGYYIYSDEVTLLEETGEAIVNATGGQDIMLVDLGVGGEGALIDKIKPLIQKFRGRVKTYVGVDKVPEILEQAKEFFAREFPEIEFIGLQQDFFKERLELPRSNGKGRQKRLTAIFGQTAFNIEAHPSEKHACRDAVVANIKALAQNLRTSVGDVLLMTNDFNRDEMGMLAGYAEQKDVWENVLLRIRRDLPVSDTYDPKAFRFVPRWFYGARSIGHMWIVERDITFSIGDDNRFDLKKDEDFCLHVSNKPSLEFLKPIIQEAAMRPLVPYTPQINKRTALHILGPTNSR